MKFPYLESDCSVPGWRVVSTRCSWGQSRAPCTLKSQMFSTRRVSTCQFHRAVRHWVPSHKSPWKRSIRARALIRPKVEFPYKERVENWILRSYEIFQVVKLSAGRSCDEFNLRLEIVFNLQIFVVRHCVHERRGHALTGQRRHTRGTVLRVALGDEIFRVRGRGAATRLVV